MSFFYINDTYICYYKRRHQLGNLITVVVIYVNCKENEEVPRH